MDDRLEPNTIVVEEPGFKQGFTMIPNVILKTPHLTHGAKLCYAVLLSYAWQEGSCFPGQDRLADDLAVEVISVQRYLRELREKEVIRVQRRGLGKTNIYYIKRLSDISFLMGLDPSQVKAPDTSPTTH